MLVTDILFCVPVCFNPFPHNDTFWRPWETGLLKTLWEKEKLLITSNFSFTQSVCYPFREVSVFSSNSTVSSADCFNLDQSKICHLVKPNRSRNTGLCLAKGSGDSVTFMFMNLSRVSLAEIDLYHRAARTVHQVIRWTLYCTVQGNF